MEGAPFIPENIVVHLGAPDQPAENITIPFIDYIKNVASSEIYAAWPLESLKSNIYAQISFALNRIYTEWYRAKGYNFDITSSTQYDQKFIPGRNIYKEISDVVDEVFNDYLRKEGTINPYFAEYCNGTTVTCPGLSQWGTVDLAEGGLSALQIIQYYYGTDTQLVENAKTAENVPSYPGIALKQGDFNDDVRRMQLNLNRISNNYPAIPKIPQTDGAFGKSTTDAVTAFQKIFNLTPDGIIGKATWYKIISVYNAVKKLGELEAEGIKLSEVPNQLSRVLKRGATGGDVLAMQYFLAFIANFDDRVPSVAIDGVFGPNTEAAVKAFQQSRGLNPDGIVGRETARAGYDAYKGIISYIAKDIDTESLVPYPGVVLKRGMTGPSVKTLQEQLSFISRFIYQIPSISADGNFGAKTQAAVIDFQEIANLPATGEVDQATWEKLAEIYINIKLGNIKGQGQFPGYIIEQR